MRIRGMIFDMDGTLLDSLEDIAASCNAALKTMGFPTHPVAGYRYFVGDGVRTLLERTLPETVRQDSEILRQALTIYTENYRQHWADKSHLYDGISELLDELQAEGMKIGVLSNKPNDFVQRCVSHFLSRWNWDAALGQQESIPKKPDPAGGRFIQESWNLSASEIAYVGDTCTDMQTAENAGFFSIGVTWGFRPESELRAFHAQAIAHTPSEILEILRTHILPSQAE